VLSPKLHQFPHITLSKNARKIHLWSQQKQIAQERNTALSNSYSNT
jgi:hypothetical protein